MSTPHHEIVSAPLPLEAGTYRLTEQVSNPRPDRRANQRRITSWESWATWPAGMLFVVDLDPEFPTLNRIYPQGGIRRLSRHDAAFSVLIVALERIQEQPSDYILRHGVGLVPHYALGVLDRIGVPVERVAEIMKQMDQEDEEQEGRS